MRIENSGLFAIPIILIVVIMLVGRTFAQTDDIHGVPRVTPVTRSDEIINSLRASCDDGDRFGNAGDSDKAEAAWRICIERFRSFIESDSESINTRQRLQNYLNERERRMKRIKSQKAENDASVRLLKEDCTKGDEYWQENLYSIAQAHWNSCLSGLQARIKKMSDDPDGAAALQAFIDEQRKMHETHWAKLKEWQAQDELERKDREQKRKEQEEKERADLLEKRRKAQELLSNLDKEEIRSIPPRRMRSGAVPVILAYLNDYLHNPKSLQIVRWGTPRLVRGSEMISGIDTGYYPWYWMVAVRYRARNGFNALILVQQIFYIRKNLIVKVETL